MRLFNMNIVFGRKIDSWVRQEYGSSGSSVMKAMSIIVANVLATEGKISFVRRVGRKIGRKYNRYGLSVSTYVNAVNILAQDGWVEHYKGKSHIVEEKRESSWIKYTDKLYAVFGSQTRQEMDKIYSETLQTIILRDKNKDFIDYRDNTNIHAMRKAVDGLNDVNKQHVFTFQDQELDNWNMVRIFNNSFEEGGRWYKADVQQIKQRDSSKLPLPVDQTRLGVLIDNSPVIEIDFRSLHPLLIYAINDLDVHKFKGDFYQYVLNNMQEYKQQDRELVKLAVVIMINSLNQSKACAALQKEINFNKGVYTFKSGWDVFELVYDSYEEIQHYFCSEEGTGLRLQYLDSKIVEEVARDFVKEGKPLLPIHDSFVVKSEDENMLIDSMCWAFRKVTGNDSIPIGLKIKRWDGSEENYID